MNEYIDTLAQNIVDNYTFDEIQLLLDQKDYTVYQDDPVLFCEEVLEQTLTDDMKRMLCSVRDNRITIAVSGNATGKTFGSSSVCVWWKVCFPGSQVITAAAPPAERNLKRKLWGEIKAIVRQRPELFTDYNINKLSIVEKTDEMSFIEGVTIPMSGSEDERESKFSGSHRPYLMFVLDEGDAIPDEIYRAIDGCMSGGYTKLLVMFNPKRKLGAAYRKIQMGQAAVVKLSAFDHPNVQTGEDVIPGAITREMTVKRINEWTKLVNDKSTIDGTCFEVPGFLVGSIANNDNDIPYPPLQEGYRKIEVAEFYYKVLGKYPAQGSNQLISEEWYNRARSRWDLYVAEYGMEAPKDIRPTLGMDVADEGGDYNTLCVRYGNWAKEIVKWRGMDVDLSATKAAQIHAELRALYTNVESDGLGAGVAPHMNRIGYWYCEKCDKTYMGKDIIKCPDCGKEMKWEHIDARKIRVGSKPTIKSEMGEFNRLRDQLWWALREWLRTDQAMLPPGDTLREDLLCPDYEIRDSKVKVMSKIIMKGHLGRSSDEADSLIQTFFIFPRGPRIRMLG